MLAVMARGALLWVASLMPARGDGRQRRKQALLPSREKVAEGRMREPRFRRGSPQMIQIRRSGLREASHRRRTNRETFLPDVTGRRESSSLIYSIGENFIPFGCLAWHAICKTSPARKVLAETTR